MITVRFPNGQSIRYNNVRSVSWGSEGKVFLHESKDMGWVVCVPPGALIEFVSPCSVSNPLLSPDESIDIVLANVREFRGDKLRKLKTALQKFDCRNYGWRD